MSTRLGRYEIVSKLAEGGMAEVLVARLHGASGFTRRFAIKRLLPAMNADPDAVQLFLNEARIASTLSHPNICQIFELGLEGDEHFIVMEYLEGRTLSRVAREARQDVRPLAPALCAWVIARAAEGLAHAHEKTAEDGTPLHIVHRDVSPDNIMLTQDGQVKVLDFGIARAADQLRKTKTGQVRGKVAYMSPEQIRGEQVDARSDVFALGVVLWELLANERRFPRHDDVQMMYAVLEGRVPQRPAGSPVPEVLWRIAESAMAVNAVERLPSARALAARLDQAIADLREPSGSGLVARLVGGVSSAAVMPTAAAPTSGDATRALGRRFARQNAWWMGGLAVLLGVGAYRLWQRRSQVEVVGGPVAVLVSARPPEPAPAAPVATRPPPTPVLPEATASVPVPAPVPRVIPRHKETKARRPERPVNPVVAPSAGADPTKPGKLVVDTRPWTKIYLDGRLLGDTPLNEVSVPSGHLRLRAVNTELNVDKTFEVDVAPQEVVRVRREW